MQVRAWPPAPLAGVRRCRTTTNCNRNCSRTGTDLDSSWVVDLHACGTSSQLAEPRERCPFATTHHRAVTSSRPIVGLRDTPIPGARGDKCALGGPRT